MNVRTIATKLVVAVVGVAAVFVGGCAADATGGVEPTTGSVSEVAAPIKPVTVTITCSAGEALDSQNIFEDGLIQLKCSTKQPYTATSGSTAMFESRCPATTFISGPCPAKGDTEEVDADGWVACWKGYGELNASDTYGKAGICSSSTTAYYFYVDFDPTCTGSACNSTTTVHSFN